MTPEAKPLTAEAKRLVEARGPRFPWKKWGPYLSERAWGTVPEDYSEYGTPWEYFPHDHARSKAYRWHEDGLAGISDDHQTICFALALWNGRDPILKERLFGLTGNEGRHGEDVKECYYYLDSTPTHSYMKYLYKYPQAAFPYQALVDGNAGRTRDDPEFEVLDTGVFADNRYFDVFVEYAKAGPRDILIRITAENRGPDEAALELLPTVWFRNTWSWGVNAREPHLTEDKDGIAGGKAICLDHFELPEYRLSCEGAPELLFTHNETNYERLYATGNPRLYVKDGINDFVVHGQADAVNPEPHGTKAAARYQLTIGAGQSATLRLRLSTTAVNGGAGPVTGDAPFGAAFDETFAQRIREADEFFAAVAAPGTPDDALMVQRQAFAGLLWSKQYYHYTVRRWLRGDAGAPPPPHARLHGRNSGWGHLHASDVFSMPDKWEYPWFAAWDLAFHAIPLTLVDPDFAKDQLLVLLNEWYQHPNGQLPAFEWNFSDVNPPVHAWAAWRVYLIEAKQSGRRDRMFLERVFHKLLLNFTWWVNRKDADGNNVFQGGFLGLDNIGVMDRSAMIPEGGTILQPDATSWMGMYCLNMMVMALELARENPAYEYMASKFLEHFVYIARALNNMAGDGVELWNRRDGFFYDVLRMPNGSCMPMRVRSLVGLIPLFAVDTIESETVDALPAFKRRMQYFIDNVPEFSDCIEVLTTPDGIRRFFSLVSRDRLRAMLGAMLNEEEFLSPHGIRSLSRFHKDHPWSLRMDGREYRIDYEPAESRTGLFGGNSNWRGPVWFPLNYLIIESLQKFHWYMGESFQVECPTGSGQVMDLWQVSLELERRLTSLFLRDEKGERPFRGANPLLQDDPYWRDLILFYEYFHGDDGRGLGANHQTGWTGLVAKLIQQRYGSLA